LQTTYQFTQQQFYNHGNQTMTALTPAHLCIFAVAIMPIICAGLSKAGGDSRYNNRHPREWYAKLEGWRSRAAAAQSNCWEALPFFGLAVVVAHQLQAAPALLNNLAISFVLLRAVYIALYLANLHWQRTLVWTAAFGVNIAIFFMSGV
jgi:uncharacterized MAPEG superfamily protein